MLNLGILAHVDAGKTSLTERLLYAGGVIDAPGRVDDGSTVTDSMALERQRGITIRSAVASFVVPSATGATAGTTVGINLIDTPGHPDFIAEVERVLSVLDGAVLVVSAVEGVQPQTRVLMRALRRLRLPTLVFINKIDRSGACPDAAVRALVDRLGLPVVVLGTAGSRTGAVRGAVGGAVGGAGAMVTPYGRDDPDFVTELLNRLADNDDRLVADYLRHDDSLGYDRLRRDLAKQTRQALVHPVFLGSAITGAGVDWLIDGITELLPTTVDSGNSPMAGTVFKVERGSGGEKIAYVRMRTGTIHVRDRVAFSGTDAPVTNARVTAIRVFDRGGAEPRNRVSAGQIGQLWGLNDVRIGDTIGGLDQPAARAHFAPPTLESIVVPRRPSDRGALHAALTQLAEQDPLINVRRDDVRQEISVSLYGEVQKEVIGATLAMDYGVEVTFDETTTICVERLAGTGSAVETIVKGVSPFLAGIGLRVEPSPVGSGISFGLEVELGAMPPAFFKAVEESVRETLHQGLYGWVVPDCVVRMTYSDYWPRQSHMHATFDKSMSSSAGDFRHLTPLVLMAALRRAGTTIHQPWHRFQLEVPTDLLGSVLPVVIRLGGLPAASTAHGLSTMVNGEIPAARVHVLRQHLPGLTRGEGSLETSFGRYAPVIGETPTRARSDHNPLNRKEYLLHVVRRV
jgi:ribosomal protection tetracycline resistance protein